ncbi:MAG TPA: class I SAM-dependent methyltransferase [Alphaproteobacteria bacterium]|nr:class I SAM-dependent methyltransferase [Alphaproteobacteria bacterium]
MKLFFILLLLSLNFSSLGKAIAANDKANEGPWSSYFQSQINAQPHDLVTKAFDLIKTKRALTIIDLGVGNGKDITKILKAGAVVYAYDADPESINIINKRFNFYIRNNKLFTHQMFFEDITALPTADMIISINSLPFMRKDKLLSFWKIVEDSLTPNGIFVGTFFGEKHYAKRNPKRPALFRLNREELLTLFKSFQILYFHEDFEYDENSSKSWGTDQFDHRYKVIARKKG